jgi:hypothetical protein
LDLGPDQAGTKRLKAVLEDESRQSWIRCEETEKDDNRPRKGGSIVSPRDRRWCMPFILRAFDPARVDAAEGDKPRYEDLGVVGSAIHH